jgi:hypothetical protein
MSRRERENARASLGILPVAWDAPPSLRVYSQVTQERLVPPAALIGTTGLGA